MSGASRSRAARARALQASRKREADNRWADWQAGQISLLISIAGQTERGPRGSRVPKKIRVARSPMRNGGTRPITITAPPLSAVPALRKQLQRAGLSATIVRAQTNLQSAQVVPYFPIASRSLRGASRRAKAKALEARKSNKSIVSRTHNAKVALFNARNSLKEFDKGSPLTASERGVAPIAPFLIQGSGQKLKTLSDQSGFDVGSQLRKTNERFGLNLTVDDVTANFTSGGLLGEASALFTRNRKIDKIKTTLTPEAPTTVNLDENSDFDLLFDRRKSIVDQQQGRLDEINKVGDENLRLARIETELPLFNTRAGEIDGLISGLNTRISGIKKTRKPQELLSATGSLQNFSLKTLVERRNTLTKIRNEKVGIFNEITDPALRHVTKTQDIPQFDNRISELDSNIDQAVKFGESRKQLDISIQNAPTKRRGRAPKTFDVTIGGEKRTFKRNERGARKAGLFFNEIKAKKAKEVAGISDPINRAVASDQDLGILDLGLKASKTQRKVLKNEKRQELESLNIGGASGSSFQPFTPADTPTGKLATRAIPKGRGVPRVFDQLNIGGGGRKRATRNEIDIGGIFGDSGRTKIQRRNRGFDFF